MATTIQVVLQSDVHNVGTAGELVKVRPGFARNFLLPRRLAVPATAAAVNRISHEKAVAVARTEKARKEARDLAAKLGGVTLTITQKGGDDGRLFGSVTSKDIEAAAKAAGFTIDRKTIHLPEHIKTAGAHEVDVKLFSDIHAKLKVEVVTK